MAPGRHPKSPADRRTEHLDIRLTPGERAQVGEAAEAHGIEPSVWARAAVLRRLDEERAAALAQATARQISPLVLESENVRVRHWRGAGDVQGRAAVTLLRTPARVHWWLQTPAGEPWEVGEAPDWDAADAAARAAAQRLSPEPVTVLS